MVKPDYKNWKSCRDWDFGNRNSNTQNKILVARLYKPPNLGKIDFTVIYETFLSKLLKKYEKLILMGDFNMTMNNPNLGQFLDTFALL